MALLFHAGSDRNVALAARVLVGRDSTADLRLTDRAVSSMHAVLIWRDDAWHIRDLGSRNGTTMDGLSVEPGQLRPVAPGATLRFGSDAQVWSLTDAGPPGVVATAGDVVVSSAAGLLALPDDDDPQVTLFASANGRWLAELDGAPRYVQDGETIDVGGVEWRLALPCGAEHDAPSTLADAGGPRGLRFAVSSDEEFVEVHVGAEQIPARAFHYLLLTLARLRARDAVAEISPAEQGWVHVEDLCRMLDTDRQRLNVDVFRARQQFARLGICEPAELVERRSTSRQLRFGRRDFRIDRL